MLGRTECYLDKHLGWTTQGVSMHSGLPFMCTISYHSGMLQIGGYNTHLIMVFPEVKYDIDGEPQLEATAVVYILV